MELGLSERARSQFQDPSKLDVFVRESSPVEYSTRMAESMA
jgi:hypothetical protein